MKKLITISVLTIAILLTACSNTEISPDKGQENDINITEVRFSGGHYDRWIPYTLEELMNEENIFNTGSVVIGEFIGETEFRREYKYDDFFKKDILRDVYATNQLQIVQVLKGDIKVGDVVTMDQRYDYDEKSGVFTVIGDLTPMHKGDRWIYFLGYDESVDIYFNLGNPAGRYPLPNKELMQNFSEFTKIIDEKEKWLSDKETLGLNAEKYNEMRGNGDIIFSGSGEEFTITVKGYPEEFASFTFDKNLNFRVLKTREDVNKDDEFIERMGAALDKIETADLGLFNRDDFNFILYAEILEYFNIEETDYVNPGREFDAKLISLVEKQTAEQTEE